MPARSELQRWVTALEAQLEPASDSHIGFLVKTMANSMAMRSGQTQQLASRTDGWLLACGSLPADLWTQGCTELLSTKTFMPSPGELMAIVGRKFEERRRMLERAKKLLGEDPDAGKPKPFEPEPRTVRLRNMITSYRKHGYTSRAAKFEIELAEVEGRAPEDWTRAAQAEPMVDMRDTTPTRPPSPQMRAALDMAVAQHHRAQGRGVYADRLERRAVESGYVAMDAGEPPPHDDVPEAMEAR
jgi:hypothetical protein